MATKKQKISNVPNLRFPGFEGEWEEKGLGGVCKMQSGKFVSASEISETLQDGLFPCYGGNGLRGYTKSFNHNGKYSLIGRQGALCGNITLANGKFHATEHAVVVTPNNGIDKVWMFYLLTHLNLNRYATGMAQPGLSVQNLEKVEAVIPKSEEEQRKISVFLSLVDERIQTQNKIIEDLETLIQNLREKLFMQKLMFNNDNGEGFPKWKVMKLGEIGDIVTGLTYNPNEIDEKGVLVLRSSNVQRRALTFDDNVFVSVSKYNPVLENDILICVRNGSKDLIGKNAIIKKEHAGYAFGAFMTIYRSTYNKFVFQWFDTEQYKSEVHKNLGATINSINGRDLKNFKVPFPSKIEQAKIANFLSSIDNKIEMEKSILSQYENQKKYLLRNMFT